MCRRPQGAADESKHALLRIIADQTNYEPLKRIIFIIQVRWSISVRTVPAVYI